MKFFIQSDSIQSNDTIGQAKGHIKNLKSSSFVFWLSLFQKIMPLVEMLFNQLQKVNCDTSMIVQNLDMFAKNIQNIRDRIDSEGFSSDEPCNKRRKLEDNNTEAKEVCDNKPIKRKICFHWSHKQFISLLCSKIF